MAGEPSNSLIQRCRRPSACHAVPELAPSRPRRRQRAQPHPQSRSRTCKTLLANSCAEKPRRSDRSGKGQHKKNASTSPAPSAKPVAKSVKAKSSGSGSSSSISKKPGGQEPVPPEDDEDEEEEELIRCICGNTDPKDKRAFIGCDACTVWQHNVCMGVHDDEDDVPEHYFCEECRPEEHPETIQAIRRGEKIWETRNRIFQNEKKMSKSRKSRTKTGEPYRPGWLKKDVAPEPEETVQETVAENEPQPKPQTSIMAASQETSAPANGAADTTETGNKRKRSEAKEEPEDAKSAVDEKMTRSSRQEKRRKSSTAPSKAEADTGTTISSDADTALLRIDQLPQDRQRAARALASAITSTVEERVRSGHKTAKGQNATALGDLHAARIEYALHMNYGGNQQGYSIQFRALLANFKKNHVLVERLLNGSLTSDEISTMSSSDMASEDLQRQRAEMKEVLDRQATVDQPEGPKYAQDHKGYHLVESETPARRDGTTIGQAMDGSPNKSVSPPRASQLPPAVDTMQRSGIGSRSSSQQFDMKGIWEKTANSPTLPTGPQDAAIRPTQVANRRRSSVHRPQAPTNGAKDDPDIDRMLEDHDDTYPQAEGSGESVIWRGKLIQTSEEGAPVVNGRFVAGRDLQAGTSWQHILPPALSIDGRLAISKAEDYLCGLRWSSSSDVSVLQLTPDDNAEAFNAIFDYFHTRKRYAVVAENKPVMIKDLYIIPVEVGETLPGHVEMLEHCTLQKPVQERVLLATIIVARAPDSPSKSAAPQQSPANGHLPQHVRQSIGGPAGSPLNPQHATFSPSNSVPPQQPGYGPPVAFPPNPYGPQAQPPQPPVLPVAPPRQPHPDPQVSHILGDLQYASSAQTILSSAPSISTDQLQNLRAILLQYPETQTQFDALTQRLYASSQ